MISERGLDGHARSAETWFKRANKRNPERGGALKSRELMNPDWIAQTRQVWEQEANRALERERREIDASIGQAEQAIRRDVLVKKHGLSDHQAHAIGHILENRSLTIQDFERLCPDTNRRSLQRDLKAMIQKGIVLEKATSPTDPTKSYVLGGPG